VAQEVFDEEGLLITDEAFCETKFLSKNIKYIAQMSVRLWLTPTSFPCLPKLRVLFS
jgi:hypothetical protein